MSVFGVLAADNKVAASRLGTKTVMDWLQDRFSDIRGIDRWFCATTEDLRRSLMRVADRCDETLAVSGAAGADCRLWLPTLRAMPQFRTVDVLLLLNAACPFIPGPKIEECVFRAERTALACLARTASVCEWDGKFALWTDRPADVCGLAHNRTLPSKPNNMTVVPLSMKASLRVSEPEQLVMASALIGAGKA